VLILGDEKDMLLLEANNEEVVLDLEAEPQRVKQKDHANQYDNLFDF